jgi:predicted permease
MAFAFTALAIGIGANTGVFSVVDAMLLRSLPFHEPERVAILKDFIPPHDSVADFNDWRQRSRYLEDAALFEAHDVNLDELRFVSRAHVVQTSWNFFVLLGASPILGRAFLPGDDVDGTGLGSPGRNSVAVIGYGLWQQLFGGDHRVLGTTIRIDGTPLTVIGVAPPGFDFPNKAVLWKPAAFSPGNNGWVTVARLRQGISWHQARAAFAVDAERLLPKERNSSNVVQPRIISLQDALSGPVRNASLMFMGAVALVLLIACTNVANLLLSGVTERGPELAVRSVLGASVFRLTQQLLIECLLLCVIAGCAGLLIAYWITRVAMGVQPPALETQSYSILDVRVLAFTLGMSVGTAFLLGVLPAVYTSRICHFRSRSAGQTRGSRRVVQTLVVAQIVFTTVLLAASVCLGRALVHLTNSDRGYDVKGVVTLSVSLGGTSHELGGHQLPYFEEVLDRIRILPGVRAASATEFLPLYASAFLGGPFGLDGQPANHGSTMIPVLSDYFRTMGSRILYGREFTDAEIRSGARVAVINDRFADQFGTSQNVVGHQLTIGAEAPRKIIGVVKGMEYETDPAIAHGDQVFIPSSTPGSFFSTFVIRVDGHAEDYLPMLRDAVRSVDPRVPVFGVKTMEQRLHETYASPRFYRTAVWSFAVFALMLAIIGIYGTVSYGVVQRTQEMGIRMALGRTPLQIRSMLLRGTLRLVVAGAILGIIAAQITGRFFESLIDGAKPVGLLASSSLVFLFALVASLSVWSGTRRIASFDVLSILRNE